MLAPGEGGFENVHFFRDEPGRSEPLKTDQLLHCTKRCSPLLGKSVGRAVGWNSELLLTWELPIVCSYLTKK